MTWPVDKWTALRACPLIHRPYDYYCFGNHHFEAMANLSVTLSIDASRVGGDDAVIGPTRYCEAAQRGNVARCASAHLLRRRSLGPGKELGHEWLELVPRAKGGKSGMRALFRSDRPVAFLRMCGLPRSPAARAATHTAQHPVCGRHTSGPLGVPEARPPQSPGTRRRWLGAALLTLLRRNGVSHSSDSSTWPDVSLTQHSMARTVP